MTETFDEVDESSSESICEEVYLPVESGWLSSDTPPPTGSEPGGYWRSIVWSSCRAYYIPFDVALSVPVDDYRRLFQLASQYLQRHRDSSRSLAVGKKSIPTGYWYMITIPAPKGKPREYINEVHDKAMAYFKRASCDVYVAGLEFSSIWHVHYFVRMTTYNKNTVRDLKRATGNAVVNLQPKITDLKRFRGAVNYCLKRNYDEDQTAIDILVKRVEIIEGKGMKIEGINSFV